MTNSATPLIAGHAHTASSRRTLTMATGGEVDSLESLLEAAGERALSQEELSEVKRILYGNPAR